ncbi:MAG: RlmE family RNA methyltransferase [Thermodesulfobacteriota bacterium]
MNHRQKSKPNQWEDHYTRKARKENKPARSVYKLEEIQAKFHLIRKGDKVLDLGCAPGSWLLFAAEQAGSGGQVVGIDRTPLSIPVPPHVRVWTGDILAPDEELTAVFAGVFDVVLSDMAPATTGNRIVDATRSLELCQAALDIAGACLRPGGSFVCKIFQGEDFKSFADTVRRCFDSHKIFKPQSCRKASKEIYIIGKGKQQEALCQDTANGRASSTKKPLSMPNAEKSSPS